MLAPAPAAALTRISAASTAARYSGPAQAARVQIQDGEMRSAIESCTRPAARPGAEAAQPPPCWLLLPVGYLGPCEPTGPAGHRRPVPASEPVRRPGGASRPGSRGPDPAACPGGTARPAL